MLLVQAPQVRVAAVLPMALDPKEEVALLHEHYKDSFAHVLVREQRRDRLFVILVLMFALLTLQVQYPATVGDALGTVKVLGVDVTVKNLPLPALLDVTWLLTLLVGLKYCQTALAVERQYPYLHQLEEAIAGRLSNAELFCREGKAYLRAYPSVLNWAWFCYVVLFPLAVLAGTSLLMVTAVARPGRLRRLAQAFLYGHGRSADRVLRSIPSDSEAWSCRRVVPRARR
ncbi:MAG: hypothetical protein M3Q48_12415 [Actinomycetota bacterium]|nr:hypothetical protein [Actinomycetota bacterium]